MLSTIEEPFAGTRSSLSFRPISRVSYLHRNDNQPQARSWAKTTYWIHSQYDLARVQYPREYPCQCQKLVSLAVCKHRTMVCRWGLSPGSFLQQNSNDPTCVTSCGKQRLPTQDLVLILPCQGKRNTIPLRFATTTILGGEAPVPPSDVYSLSLRAVFPTPL